jgi:diacylglycerol kinase family enzyme
MLVGLQDNITSLPVGTVNTFGHPISIPTNSGQATQFVTLAAVTGNATGATMDCGASHQACTMVAVGTGTLAGTLTIEMSLDGVTWVPSGGTVALTAAATVTATQGSRAARYWRVSLSAATGTGSVTANIMANG